MLLLNKNSLKCLVTFDNVAATYFNITTVIFLTRKGIVFIDQSNLLLIFFFCMQILRMVYAGFILNNSSLKCLTTFVNAATVYFNISTSADVISLTKNKTKRHWRQIKLNFYKKIMILQHS